MKKSTVLALTTGLMLAGCAMASAAPRASLPHGCFPSGRLVEGGEITVDGVKFRISSPAPRHHGRPVAGFEGVIDTPLGTPQEYSKTSGGYYFYAGYSAYQDSDQAATIYWDDDDAYIYNILSYKETYSYVKGTRDGGRLVVPLNQTVAEEDEFAVKLGLLKTVLTRMPNPDWEEDDDEDMKYTIYIFFEYNEDFDTVEYTIGDDGTLTLVIPECPGGFGSGTEEDEDITYLDPADYGFPDYALGFYYTDDYTWTGDGDIFQTYEEFNYERVTLPEDIELGYYSYVNSFDVGVLVYAGRVGDTLYVKGLSAYAPDAVFKARLIEVDGGYVASIPQNQFIGQSPDGYYNLLTRTIVFDPASKQYVLAPADVPATFFVNLDEDGKFIEINSMDANNVLVFNYAGPDYDPYDEFGNISLKYQESLAGTPKAPAGAYFEDHSQWLGANFLFFYMSQFSEEGYILDVNELFYRIEINGEPYVFEEHDGENLNGNFVTMYSGMKTPSTLVPYSFYNGFDLWSDEYHLFYVGFYTTDISTIGVQTVYTYGGETRTSEMVTIDCNAVKGVDSDAEAVSTDYYDLNGVRLNRKPAGGLYIVRSVLSDGTVKMTKAIGR